MSIVKIRKSKGPNIDRCGTLAEAGSHEEI